MARYFFGIAKSFRVVIEEREGNTLFIAFLPEGWSVGEDIYSVDAIRKFAFGVEHEGEYHSVLCRIAYKLSVNKMSREEAKDLLAKYDYPNDLNPKITHVDFSEGPTE